MEPIHESTRITPAAVTLAEELGISKSVTLAQEIIEKALGLYSVRPEIEVWDKIHDKWEGRANAAYFRERKDVLLREITSWYRSIPKYYAKTEEPTIKADVLTDPDENGHTTICFRIRFDGSVDEALMLNEIVKQEFIDRIPPADRFHLSVDYDLK